ncbi:hypothetical protein H696_01497 [Fonticula alba]|uniref:MADS-box domain-containing protein n=1 Tax=Fonticula alba TaxID=691883 RepID=A0A058ZCF3_FONAL|nr:hypothetical protein H696_01497 [Fonticula alba]KCV72090.1 hypothetical protein H696_01497 [Fonticula alba]|eukprot:XP_009493668.1 hypothetical protein H696_01497 [Fonticula alba]
MSRRVRIPPQSTPMNLVSASRRSAREMLIPFENTRRTSYVKRVNGAARKFSDLRCITGVQAFGFFADPHSGHHRMTFTDALHQHMADLHLSLITIACERESSCYIYPNLCGDDTPLLMKPLDLMTRSLPSTPGGAMSPVGPLSPRGISRVDSCPLSGPGGSHSPNGESSLTGGPPPGSAERLRLPAPEMSASGNDHLRRPSDMQSTVHPFPMAFPPRGMFGRAMPTPINTSMMGQAPELPFRSGTLPHPATRTGAADFVPVDGPSAPAMGPSAKVTPARQPCLPGLTTYALNPNNNNNNSNSSSSSSYSSSNIRLPKCLYIPSTLRTTTTTTTIIITISSTSFSSSSSSINIINMISTISAMLMTSTISAMLMTSTISTISIISFTGSARSSSSNSSNSSSNSSSKHAIACSSTSPGCHHTIPSTTASPCRHKQWPVHVPKRMAP